jgi:hypothetical protein
MVSECTAERSVRYKKNNVLVTLYEAKRLEEYTTDGELIRQIKIDRRMDYVQHSVQLSADCLLCVT